jgi:hypothetical protein
MTQNVTESETKPVAWMMVHCENGSAYLTFEKPTRQQKITHIPHELYTSPQYRELSDKEIMQIYEKCWEGELTIEEIQNSEIRFAKAILREAQEK